MDKATIDMLIAKMRNEQKRIFIDTLPMGLCYHIPMTYKLELEDRLARTFNIPAEKVGDKFLWPISSEGYDARITWLEEWRKELPSISLINTPVDEQH